MKVAGAIRLSNGQSLRDALFRTMSKPSEIGALEIGVGSLIVAAIVKSPLLFGHRIGDGLGFIVADSRFASASMVHQSEWRATSNVGWSGPIVISGVAVRAELVLAGWTSFIERHCDNREPKETSRRKYPGRNLDNLPP